MKLWGYWRSSAAYRVRIALELKGLEAERVEVSLARGEQLKPAYKGLNPQGLVPALEEGGRVFAQSLAILEYLEETRPLPPLLPATPGERARVRQLALIIACDVHPLQNLGALQYLSKELGCDEETVLRWNQHWIRRGFEAFERLVADAPATGRCCHGDQPSFADVCLIPQMYNARRRQLDLAPFPTLRRIEEHCLALPAFARAAPERAPDAG